MTDQNEIARLRRLHTCLNFTIDDKTADTAVEAVEIAIAAFAGLAMSRDTVRALLRMALDVSADLDEAAGVE